jgi:hypothetical protein
MDAYYQQQSQTPYFSGHARQRGSGIGALVAGIGRVALPFVKRVVLPFAKRIGRELFTQGAPEILDVIAKRKTPKQALRQTISNTVRKQVGGGRPKKKPKKTQKRRATSKATRKRKAVIPAKGSAKRSRLSIFSNVNGNDY